MKLKRRRPLAEIKRKDRLTGKMSIEYGRRMGLYVTIVGREVAGPFKTRIRHLFAPLAPNEIQLRIGEIR